MKFLTRLSTRLMERYLPDAYIFVILLSILVFILGSITNKAPLNVVDSFGSGFWSLMSFTVQMTMVLLCGSVMAKSPFFKNLLISLAKAPKSAGSAIIMIAAVSSVACWINWGFGLVLGALIAREVARQRSDTDYRLLIASAYSGFLLWHGGIAGSIPLSIATPAHPYEAQIGVIQISETLFTTGNLVICIALLITIPALCYFMHPSKDERVIIDPALLVEPEQEPKPEKMTPAERLEHSKVLNIIIGVLGWVYIISYFIKGGTLNLNIINFIFFFAAIVLHGTPRNFLNAVEDSIRAVGPILIQFPFYAAIMAMMTQSGLATAITNAFVDIASENNFYVLSFLSAGLVNFFVPSGGGQWAVQAPVMIEAVNQMNSMGANLDQTKMAMAIAWGDSWTNMIQPFWALPALAIAGLKARDIMGFCVFNLILSGLIISAVFYFIY
ncbi:Short-chain fatty acids transporter [Oligella ureolytica]|uniref:short-chain fatty acid transporter n=1 Tax=Oligella ureolytica TaxID=90244 RepID=UPI000DFA05D8|nr:TIGR00366 family protein [Oligella ureolytica]SUA58735.1 Short-chain fatty acids transporter [Oligella ureolytica]